MTSPAHITVVQIAKLRDLIFSLPALRGLRQKHPKSHIRLICRKSFSPLIKQQNDSEGFADEILELDSALWLLPFIDPETRWDEKTFQDHQIQFEKWIQSIRRDNDLVFNLTFSPTSARLTYLLSHQFKGIAAKTDSIIVEDPWSQYFCSSVQTSGINRFHLTDLLKCLCHVEDQTTNSSLSISAAQRAATQKLLLRYNLMYHQEHLVAVHTGSSEPSRRWPLKKYAETIDLLHEFFPKYVFVFTGNADEREAIDEAIGQRPYCRNIAGQTDLMLLAGLFERCKLVISNQTMPLHIAVSLGKPTLMVALHGERFWEEGPCHEGHYIVRAIQKIPSPQVVAEVAHSILLNEEHFIKASLNMVQEEGHPHRVYISKRKTHGLLQYVQVGGSAENTIEGWYIDSYNHTRFEELSGVTFFNTVIYPADVHKALDVLQFLEVAFQKAQDAGEFGLIYGEMLKREWKRNSPDPKEVRILGQRLQEVDQLLKDTAASIPHLLPLLNEFEIEQIGLILQDHEQTVEGTLNAYFRFIARCKKIKEKIVILREHLQALSGGPLGSPPQSPQTAPQGPGTPASCLAFDPNDVTF